MQECEAELRQQKALASQGDKMRAREREAEASQPLEASQRAVIRDLSLKLAQLGRLLAASKADKSLVQVSGCSSGSQACCRLPHSRMQAWKDCRRLALVMGHPNSQPGWLDWCKVVLLSGRECWLGLKGLILSMLAPVHNSLTGIRCRMDRELYRLLLHHLGCAKPCCNRHRWLQCMQSRRKGMQRPMHQHLLVHSWLALLGKPPVRNASLAVSTEAKSTGLQSQRHGPTRGPLVAGTPAQSACKPGERKAEAHQSGPAAG